MSVTRRYVGIGAAALLMAGALSYIGLVDPHRPGSPFPLCPFKALTGWNCPACGGLRMTYDLLHGNVAAAFNDNAFVLVGIPMLVAWILLRRRRDSQRPLPTSAWVVVVVAAIAWTVLRNLPGFPLVPTLLTG